MSENDLPTQYWHCRVQIGAEGESKIVNDLDIDELFRTIIDPWRAGRSFAVDGEIIRSTSDVFNIKVVQTQHPQSFYAERHNQEMRAKNIVDMVTNRRGLPFSEGNDFTNRLLFSGLEEQSYDEEVDVIERVCERLRRSARILGDRSRKQKKSFEVSDEYDVQDLLHATLRAFFKHSVQEDTLPKVAGAKSSRVDISIEQLGTLIEIKYARNPRDQKRFAEELSQDLLLYSEWPHLKRLIFMIYNSDLLHDPEAFERLSGHQIINNKAFTLRVILA